MKQTIVAVLTFLVTLTASAAMHLLGDSVQYQIPAAVRGWVEVEWSNPNCPALVSQSGVGVVVKIGVDGRVCTSSTMPSAWHNVSFVHVYEGDRRVALKFSNSGSEGERMVWGHSNGTSTTGPASESFFVGTKAEFERGGMPPRLKRQ